MRFKVGKFGHRMCDPTIQRALMVAISNALQNARQVRSDQEVLRAGGHVREVRGPFWHYIFIDDKIIPRISN